MSRGTPLYRLPLSKSFNFSIFARRYSGVQNPTISKNSFPVIMVKYKIRNKSRLFSFEVFLQRVSCSSHHVYLVPTSLQTLLQLMNQILPVGAFHFLILNQMTG